MEQGCHFMSTRVIVRVILIRIIYFPIYQYKIIHIKIISNWKLKKYIGISVRRSQSILSSISVCTRPWTFTMRIWNLDIINNIYVIPVRDAGLRGCEFFGRSNQLAYRGYSMVDFMFAMWKPSNYFIVRYFYPWKCKEMEIFKIEKNLLSQLIFKDKLSIFQL